MITDLFKPNRETVFFLVEELGRTGIDERSRTLISDLRRHVKVVLVGQCYLSFWHPARRLWMRHELYGLPSDRFEERLQAFAARIIERHRPSWAINHGWDNGELVGALERRDLPVLSFIDGPASTPSRESQANHTFRYAAEVLFSEHEIVRSLTISRWALDARRFDALTAGPSTIETIISVGRKAASKRVETLKQQSRDVQVIDAAGGVDPDLAIDAGEDTREATETYLRASRLNSPREGIFAGRALRRPSAGFNPLIYASDRVGFDNAGAEDPFAHFIRTGRPTGRWTHEVIRPDFEAGKVEGLAVAIHAHLHYPDLLPDLYRRLEANRTHIDLIVTTTSEQNRRDIERFLDGVTIKSIFVCANHGRNLWPFMELLREGAFRSYDVVGHIHGKRSLHFDEGAIWRDFLWSHLVGTSGEGEPRRTADAALQRFASNPRLGLVFAEEPHLEGWEMNYEAASELAARVGIARPLPFHFDYPAGAMFWVRPTALAPLLQLGLTHVDIPTEPLPVDGTILHALERLVPFFVAKAGYSFATTRIEGSRR